MKQYQEPNQNTPVGKVKFMVKYPYRIIKNMKVKLIILTTLLTVSTTNAQLTTTATSTTSSTTASTTATTIIQTGETPEKKAVVLLIKYTLDRKNTYPTEFKLIKKEFDDYLKNIENYSALLYSSSRLVYELEGGVSVEKAGAKKIAKQIDDRIKNINSQKTKLDKSYQNLNNSLKKIKNLKLVEEYNSASFKNEKKMMEQSEVTRVNIIEYLYNAKSYHTQLSTSNSKFSFINGIFFSGDYRTSVDYFDYLDRSRKINKVVIMNISKYYDLYIENDEFLKTYLSASDYELIKKESEMYKQIKTELNQNSTVASDLSSEAINLEFNRRIAEDQRLKKIITEMQNLASELSPLMPTSTNSVVYVNPQKLKEFAVKYDRYNVLDKQYAVLEYQIKTNYFKENARKNNDHLKFDYLNDAEALNIVKEIRDLVFITATVDYNSKVFNLLSKNSGNYKLAFDDNSIPYDYVFNSNKVNNEYKMLFDKYFADFSTQIKENK